MAGTSKRDQLIETALQLFAQSGFHATGVDKILEHAGVARMTLYHHFGSKQDLIIAALERESSKRLEAYGTALSSASENPRYDALRMFDLLHDRMTASADRIHWGCVFLNALAEFSDPEDQVNRTVIRHHDGMRDLFRTVINRAGFSDVDTMADRMMLLFNGANTYSQVTNSARPAQEAREMARTLIDAVGHEAQ